MTQNTGEEYSIKNMYAKDVREVRQPVSEKEMTSDQIATDAAKEFKASLAQDITEGRLSHEVADKVYNDQVDFQKDMLEHPSGDQSALTKANNDAEVSRKTLGID